MSRRRYPLLGIFFALLMFIGCSDDGTLDDGSSDGEAQARSPAPEFTLLNTELEPVSLSDYQGDVVLLDFWATWCAPCREEIPHFVELYTEYRDQGFEMLGVSLDSERLAVVEPFIEELDVNYTILLGEPRILQEYNVPVMPSAFLIDREGRIVKAFHGAQGREIYETELTNLLQSGG